MAAPNEGKGWQTHFWGPWMAAATTIHSFHVMTCTPSPIGVAVGMWYGALHAFGAIVKPVPWAPSLGEGRGSTPHGTGRKGGRKPGERSPQKKFRPVWNLEAESEFLTDTPFKMALFDLGKVALEVGYIIFLADVWRDSYVIGTSAAYRYSGCIPSHWGPATGVMVRWPISPGEHGALPWSPVYDPQHIIGTTAIGIPAGISATIGYSITLSPEAGHPNSPGTVNTWLRDQTVGYNVYGWFHSNVMNGPEKTNCSGRFHSLPVDYLDRYYSVEYYGESGWSNPEGSTLNVSDSTQYDTSLIWDP